MALSKTVISTRIGAEGIEGKSGQHFLLASDAQEFADHITMAVNEPLICREIGEQARKLIESRYSFPVINKQVEKFYQTITSK